MKKTLLFSLTFFLVLTFSFSKELPRGYMNIQLGMNSEQTKSELKRNSAFGYKGERDVSLTPDQNTVIIQTDTYKKLGSDFLTQCYFQFHDDILYSITINVNTEKMDYYSVFTTLTEKYGEPDFLNPQQTKWQDEKTTLILEKPLTLKYLDNEIFQSLQDSKIDLSPTELTREMFLDEL